MRRNNQQGSPAAIPIAIPFLVLTTLLFSAPALLIYTPALPAEEAFSFFDDGAGQEGALRWSGEVGVVTRALVDTDDPWASPLSAAPFVLTELRVDGPSSETVARLRLDGTRGIDDYRDVVEEAWLRLFYERLTVRAGSFKIVWGTGDGVHVVDVLNPMDYTDFINPVDYVDRKLATPMLILEWKTGGDSALELAWVPVFTPDRVPLDGPWVPREVATLQAGLALLPPNGPDVEALSRALFDQYTAAGQRLDHGQLGLRFTSRGGGCDYGLIYHYGFFSSPWIDQATLVEAVGGDNIDPTLLGDAISFNRRHLFGLEAATVFGGFNLRTEAAFLLSEDYRGTDAEVQNHRLAWMAGFDRNLGFSSARLNIQSQGEFILNSGDITPGDIDFNPRNEYHEVTLVAVLSDHFHNERIQPEIAAIYSVAETAGVIRPSVEFRLRDEASLMLRGSLFFGEPDTMFGWFRDRSFVEARLRYLF